MLFFLSFPMLPLQSHSWPLPCTHTDLQVMYLEWDKALDYCVQPLRSPQSHSLPPLSLPLQPLSQNYCNGAIISTGQCSQLWLLWFPSQHCDPTGAFPPRIMVEAGGGTAQRPWSLFSPSSVNLFWQVFPSDRCLCLPPPGRDSGTPSLQLQL